MIIKNAHEKGTEVEDFERELKVGFLDEAAQALADTEQCFLALESDPGNADNLNKIFRLAHNLKGSSKAVGFDEMGSFTHHFESFILKIKNGEMAASAPVVNVLLQGNDHLIKMVETLKGDINAKFDSTAILNEMAQIVANPPAVGSTTPEAEAVADNPVEASSEPVAEDTSDFFAAPTPEPEIIAAPEMVHEVALEATPEPVVEMSPEPAPVSVVVAKIEPVPMPIVTQAPAPAVAPVSPAASAKPMASAPPAANAPAAPTKSAPVDESIRVSLSKLESLLNFVGEMVILQSVMREQAHSTNSLLLKKTVHQLGKVGKEIQDISMSLRMIPVKQTFQKMQRIVRDTGQATGKDVGLTLIGEETELDKTVLEKINDPLVHLIRNSVDHGIEDQQTRISRGKPSKGQITLSAQHQSGKLVIEVKDDGGGLDAEKLKKIAISKGVLKPGVALTEKEAFNLIFAPGFSTKEKVTDVSGRGVGMDVVKTNVLDLQGDISIDSTLGAGTTIRIALPLTLAIVDAMILTYGPEKYVIPLNHVHETVRPNEKQIQNTTGLGDVLMLRGENIPIFRLGDYFNKKSTQKSTDMIAMVIRSGPSPFALLVDDILGQFQVVIKQLGPELEGFKGVSGSTILGDGKPALIIEPQDLIKRKLHISTPTPLAPTSQTASQVPTSAGGHAA